MEPKSKKILFGCLGGCGFVLLVGIGSGGGFTVWLNSPSEVLDPEVLIGPETTGYLEWKLSLEDHGTAEFVEGMLQGFGELNRRNNSPLPDGLEQFLSARQMKSATRDIHKLFPLVLAWTLRPAGELAKDEHLFTVSASGLGHQMVLLDWGLGLMIGRAEDVETVRYRGDKIFIFRETDGVRPVVFIYKGIVFMVTDIDSAHRTLDRLILPDERQVVGTELDVLFGALSPDRSLRGAVTNRGGEVPRILGNLGLGTEVTAAESWDDVRGATITAAFREDVFAGTVELHGPDSAWAQAHAESLGTALVAMLEESSIEFVTEVHAVGDRIAIDFSATDIFDGLEISSNR